MTANDCPVIPPAKGDARNTAAFATSPSVAIYGKAKRWLIGAKTSSFEMPFSADVQAT